MQQRKKRRGILGTLLLTAILVTAVFAYTNAIGMPGSTPKVGSGIAPALGTYQITNIAWNSLAGNTVDSVTLTFAAGAAPTSTVRVDVGTGWQTCSAAAGDNVTCTLGVAASAVTGLSVFAQDA
jgi:hypothetical protein